MSPFEAVYDQPPPSFIDYVSGSSSVATVDELHHTCGTILKSMGYNLVLAQKRMCNKVNVGHSDVSFNVGD